MVPSWSDFLTAWWNNYPPRLLPNRVDKPIYPLKECILRRATADDISILPEFWNKFFSQSRKTICCLDAVNTKWDIWVMVHPATGIIGSVVRRWIPSVHIKEAYFPKIGAIDYFCVHPAWRKKGVGRRLLWKAQHDTEGVIPHLMLWESIQVSVPPLVTGFYWVKECIDGVGVPVTDMKEASLAWKMCHKNRDIFSEYSQSNETVIWKTESGYVVVWNTYHRTIPEGQWIGVILGQSSERALEEFIGSCPFGILVSDTGRDGWKSDTAFQWISYMLSTGSISTSIPYLCF